MAKREPKRAPFKHRVLRKAKPASAALAPPAAPGQFSKEEILTWQDRIEDFEEGIRADAQLTGGCPLADYTPGGNAPFVVPPGMIQAIRELTSPEGRERRYRAGMDARREASHRKALANMLREKGDLDGAAAQDAAALEYAAKAAEAGADVTPEPPAATTEDS